MLLRAAAALLLVAGLSAPVFAAPINYGEFDLIAAFGFEANEAFASVTATIFVDILEVDGAAVGGVVNGTFVMTFSEGGDWLLSTDFDTAIPKHAFGDWTGALSIDIAQMLLDNSIAFADGATKLSITLDNRLTAVSAEGTTAFIAKKDFDGLTITAMPEPGLAWLVGLGLAGLLVRRRRG